MRDVKLTDEIVAVAEAIHADRYSAAQVTFLAGSVVRGEATPTSDLDLVVVYDSLSEAFRESFRHAEWPVEAFVHDPETLKYFFLRVDAPSGVPSLSQMVSEGIEVPRATGFSASMKAMANAVLSAGPPIWEPKQIDYSRYMITAMLDDLRDSRSRTELQACASALYGMLADHCLRRHGHWSAKGKWIPKRLMEVDALLAYRFTKDFDALFNTGDLRAVIELVEEVLASDGGLLFEGYRSAAPSEWRESQKTGV